MRSRANDNSELRQMIKKRLNETPEGRNILRLREYGYKLDEEDADYYKYIYGQCYNTYKNQKKEKSASFWLNNILGGNLKGFLNKYGLTIRENNICFVDCGSAILKSYVERVVIPAIEKEIGLKGLRTVRRITGLTRNILDFSKANIEDDTESDAETTEE